MKNAAAILKDATANEELAENGFTIVPYLNSSEVAELQHFFEEIVPEPPEHFFATTHSLDTDFRKRANQKIEEVLARAHAENLLDGMPLGGAFISKPHGRRGILPLHQDWNIVDESIHRSYNIWIPLVDVEEKNGAVFVLKGSHQKAATFRGPGLPSVFNEIAQHVVPKMQCVSMKAGQALIYDHALLHASPTNETPELRTAIVLGLIPRGADLRFYFLEDDRLAEYEGYPTYFFEEQLEAGPGNLRKLREVDFDFSPYSPAEFDRIFLGKQENSFLRWFKLIRS